MGDDASGPVTPAAPYPAPALLTDAALAAAIGGDEAAFADVYRALDPLLRRYARALVGQDGDDATADAWLQIARDIRGFRGEAEKFRAWCARIVRNRALDAKRAERRRPVDPVGDTTQLDAIAPRDTETTVLESLGTAQALALIASLPREQAEAVLLRAVVGLDTAGAAEVLGKSPGAVRVAAHRGLRRLAVLLGQQRTEGVRDES